MEGEELECPVCFEIFSKEIYVCQTGHSFCGGCYIMVSSCPICRNPMSFIRNRALEALITERQNVKQPECPICALPKPKKNISLTHLQNHKNKFLTTNHFAYKHAFYRTNSGRDVMVVKCHSRLFKFCVEVKSKIEKVCFTLHALDKSGNADYMFELKYNSSLKGKRIMAASLLSVGLNKAAFNYVTLPKCDFWQMNPLAFHVEVQCVISKRKP